MTFSTSWLQLGCRFALFWCCCLAPVVLAAPRPSNVVVIILDDMDSLLGALDVLPNTRQRFQTEGMSFSQALNDTTEGWCGNFLSAGYWNETFFVDVKRRGYRTGLFGKMVNLMGPMCNVSSPAIPAGFDIQSGDAFVAMCNEVVYYKNTFNVNGKFHTTGTSPDQYLQAFIGNKTIPWLRSAAAEAASGGRPFLAYLAPHAPHFPAEPAPWYMNASLPKLHAPRLPSFNAGTTGKIWAIEENPPFDAFTTDGIDRHFRNRQRSLMSVDDYVYDVFAVLEAAGVLQDTFVMFTSDHGYHLGEFRLPFEKATSYDTDIRTPFFVRGPGVAPNTTSAGMVSLLDVGATILEVTGVTQPGQRTTDGRSLMPLLTSGGSTPSSWRPEGILVENLCGYPNQWMTVCEYVYGSPCPAQNGTDVPYLINGPQNTWATLRVVNATHDVTYIEFRPQGSEPVPINTNWTEMYDLASDPFQLTNIAGTAPSAADFHNSLWAVANCAIDSCP